MQPGANLVIVTKLILFATAAQKVEQEIARGPEFVVDPAILGGASRDGRMRLGQRLTLVRALRDDGGGFPDRLRRRARGLSQLVRIEGPALFLVVREVRLFQDIRQETKFIGPEQYWPDVAVE